MGTLSLHHGDCLEIMKSIPDASVDMILCDLPYGTTACRWDSVIPFDNLWEQYERIAKPRSAIVLTACQPFTSRLVMSNPDLFRYEWIWEKNRPTGFLDANRRPLNNYESILVFSKEAPVYYPQMTGGKLHHRQTRHSKPQTAVCGAFRYLETTESNMYYPRRVVKFSTERNTVHPTQKPVALMEYLIRTYTREGETVLDNCMGSGTTGVACVNLNRNFVGIELDKKYFQTAENRIVAARL
jgi:site-specific DNA-methyltransferase (adenine-specific)